MRDRAISDSPARRPRRRDETGGVATRRPRGRSGTACRRRTSAPPTESAGASSTHRRHGDAAVPTCIFCDRPAGTRLAYAWPDWLCRFLVERHGRWCPTHGERGIDLVTLGAHGARGRQDRRRVCDTCREGWIQRLEDNVSPFLTVDDRRRADTTTGRASKASGAVGRQDRDGHGVAADPELRTPRFASEHLRKIGVHPGTQVLVGRLRRRRARSSPPSATCSARIVDGETRYLSQTSLVIGRRRFSRCSPTRGTTPPELTEGTVRAVHSPRRQPRATGRVAAERRRSTTHSPTTTRAALATSRRPHRPGPTAWATNTDPPPGRHGPRDRPTPRPRPRCRPRPRPRPAPAPTPTAPGTAASHANGMSGVLYSPRPSAKPARDRWAIDTRIPVPVRPESPKRSRTEAEAAAARAEPGPGSALPAGRSRTGRARPRPPSAPTSPPRPNLRPPPRHRSTGWGASPPPRSWSSSGWDCSASACVSGRMRPEPVPRPLSSQRRGPRSRPRLQIKNRQLAAAQVAVGSARSAPLALAARRKPVPRPRPRSSGSSTRFPAPRARSGRCADSALVAATEALDFAAAFPTSEATRHTRRQRPWLRSAGRRRARRTASTISPPP